LIKTP
jgi:hypothetical protein